MPVYAALIPVMDLNTDERSGEIAARLAAATPGPWRWRGNLDYGDPTLVGAGRCGGEDVLGSLRVDRRPDDPRLHNVEEYADGEGAARIRSEFLFDENGDHCYDERLSFTVDGIKRPARDFAIYEVCPAATTRDDPRVYRADIAGIRHPDAELIANAPGDISYLLHMVTELRAENGRLSEALAHECHKLEIKQISLIREVFATCSCGEWKSIFANEANAIDAHGTHCDSESAATAHGGPR